MSDQQAPGTIRPLYMPLALGATAGETHSMKRDGDEFDVFLCYSSRDRDAVRGIGERLRAAGLRPWFDEWQLKPGMRWLKELERNIDAARSAAVFVGESGIGPWQDTEIEAFFHEMVSRGKLVIPVLLPGSSAVPALPLFLRGLQYVDLRKTEPDPVMQLVEGIRAQVPEASLRMSTTTPPTDLPVGLASKPGSPLGSAPMLQAVPHANLVPPGGHYHADWHARRPRAEQQVMGYLETPGTPALIWGPERTGKTWLLQHILGELHHRPEPWRIAQLNLPQKLNSEQRASAERFYPALGAAIVDALNAPGDLVERAAQRPGGPNGRLDWLMERLLDASEVSLLVILDRADVLVGSPFCDDFFALLRGWAETQRPPWDRLRLLLAVSTTPLRLTESPHTSVFHGLTEPIFLGNLDQDQVLALAECHGLTWDSMELQTLVEFVGGHPYLLRMAMYETARHGTRLGDLLPTPHSDGIYASHLHTYRQILRQDSRLQAALRSVGRAGVSVLAPEDYEKLQRMGLVVRVTEAKGERYRLRCRLYERLL